METPTQTLFEKYGGKPTVDTLVEYFYEQLVLKDPLVSGYFTHIDMESQKKKQSNFISFALGAKEKYTGKTMAHVHKGMGIQDAQFNRIIDHLVKTLQVHGVEEQDVEAIRHKLNAFHDDIVEKPSQVSN